MRKIKGFFFDKKIRNKTLIYISVIMICLFGISYFGIYSTVTKIHENPNVDKVRKKPVDLSKKDSFSILLLGVDTGVMGREGGGRADSIIIVTVNPVEERTTMVSVPRDTYTKIANKNKTTKINEAYSYGGAATVINTIQKKFSIPIDFYIEVNMKGLEDVVDVLGGVTVNSPLAFSNYGYEFKKGKNKLDGKKALAYATMRHDDPRGDYGRQGRQRQIIDELIDKIISFRIIANQVGLLKSMGENVKTSLKMDDIIAIQTKYNLSLRNVKQIQVNGAGKMIRGISYQIVSENELKKISQILRKELNFKKKVK